MVSPVWIARAFVRRVRSHADLSRGSAAAAGADRFCLKRITALGVLPQAGE